MAKDVELLKAAAVRVADYGESEYRRGYRSAITLAAFALRWMQTDRSVSKAHMAKAFEKMVREACTEAGVDVPLEAIER